MKIEIDAEKIRELIETMKEAVETYECEDPHEARIRTQIDENCLLGGIIFLQRAVLEHVKYYFGIKQLPNGEIEGE